MTASLDGTAENDQRAERAGGNAEHDGCGQHATSETTHRDTSSRNGSRPPLPSVSRNDLRSVCMLADRPPR